MRLKKLEIYGFKSFAERVEIFFEDGITGIVGPNGSGKSNIADAVRWVLGEQSAKTLRGGKMEDVIFGGTEKRRRLSWCEVILTFENADRALPIDYSEVAVARRVYRNGDSEYLINRTACRLKDIVELFRDTGIGKEGYSLIGQGRIDEILSVRSEDRRQIFEEAAGIAKYKMRKTEAERRMESTRLNLSRVEDMIAELSTRLEPLRDQSESAREYLKLSEEIKGLELNVFLVRGERARVRMDELSGALEGLRQALLESEARQAELTARRDARSAEAAHLEAAAAGAREDVQTLIGDVEAREGALNVMRERIAASEREHKRLAQELSGARDGETGMEALLSDLAARIDQETEGIGRERARLLELERALEGVVGALSEREARSEQLKERVIEAMNRMSDVRSEHARLTAMRDAIDGRILALGDEAEGDRGEGDEWAERLAAAQTELAAEQSEKQALGDQLARHIARVDQAAQALESIRAQAARLTGERQEAGSRLRVLEEMQRDYEGYYNSVKHVLLQARRQQKSGVHGVVATLIQVPQRLERAIDMVLGSALQHVVVEREEDAQSMIDHLRANRLGRATFLPISAVRGRTLAASERQVLSMPGCVGLASELITCDNQYRGIVDSLLGRTVVADSLEAGIRIQRAGRHAFRLVTLEGDVMHSGGSMTGGSVQSRMTSLLSREREVAEHRRALERLTGELSALKQAVLDQEAELSALKQARGALYERIHQQEIACARAEAHVKSASDGLAAQQARGARTEDERRRMEDQRAQVLRDIGALAARQDDAQKSHAGDQAEVAALGRDIYARRTEVEKKRAEIAEIKVQLAARERGLTALEADHRRIQEERGDIESLMRKNTAALAECQARIARDTQLCAADQQALLAAREALLAARAAFSEADARRTAAQNEMVDLGARLDVLRADHDQLADRRHLSEVQLARVEAERTQMEARIWEDYELTYAGAEPFRASDFKLTESEKRIAAIRARIRALGAVNVGAVDEYRQVLGRHDEMTLQRDDLIKAQLDLAGIIDELVKKMEARFKAQFYALNDNFKEIFARLFGGGHAELQLADPKAPLDCGIEVVAQPPGKKLQMLSLLSGGERTLTAIAILFAMLKLKPTPFCFLDEIEAALDDANIDNFAEYLNAYARSTQFVVVTHRKGTMERCDALYGVAMEEKGVSKMVSIKLRDAVG